MVSIGLATIICLGSCLFVGSVMVADVGDSAQNDWQPFVALTLLFVLLFVPVAFLFRVLISRLPVVLSYFLAVGFGLLGGVAGLVLGFALFGWWLFAFGFTAWVPWIAGGTSGLLSIAALQSKKTVPKLLGVLLLPVVISLLFAYGADPFLASVLKAQEVTVTLVHWDPGTSPTIVSDPHEILNEEEKRTLHGLGLGGELRAFSQSTRGGLTGEDLPNARVVIVMQHQIDGAVELQQPYGENLIYIQNDDGWEVIPKNTRWLRRMIRLEPNLDKGKNSTVLWLELPNGLERVGGFDWSARLPW